MTSDLFSGADCVAVVVSHALRAVGEVEGAPRAGGELGLDAAGAGGGDHSQALGGGGESEQRQQQAPGHRQLKHRTQLTKHYTMSQ